MSKLKGKVALVTGESRGIGRAIAERLAQDGALVAVHYGKSREAAEAVVLDIERNGGTAFTIGKILDSSESIKVLYKALDEALKERTGDTHFDILVNNAGIALSASIEDTTEEAFDEIMTINVKTPFFLTQQRWGQPEDVADVAAFLASPDSRWVTGQLIDASGGSHL